MHQITIQTVAYCGELAREYGDVLNHFPAKNDAIPTYHPMADALTWTDELPDDADLRFKKYFVVLLQMRMRAILGSCEENEKKILEDLQQFAPSWAFFNRDRFNSLKRGVFFSLRRKIGIQVNNYVRDCLDGS